MGRVWDFFQQDANSAADRMVGPYARFVVSHSLLVGAIYLVLLVLIGVFISRTLALVLAGAMVAALVFGVAATLWNRRAPH